MTKRLEPEWESYRREVIPDDAGAIQVEECRRAFYAGSVALFKVVMTMLDPSSEPTGEDIQKDAGPAGRAARVQHQSGADMKSWEKISPGVYVDEKKAMHVVLDEMLVANGKVPTLRNRYMLMREFRKQCPGAVIELDPALFREEASA
jgi:hypothetical protein